MDGWILQKPLHILEKNSLSSIGFPWIPFKWLQLRHSSFAGEELNSILKAYRHLKDTFDIDEIASGILRRRQDDPCQRCGRCCAELLPDPVAQNTILRWIDSGNPANLFHIPVKDGPLAGKFHAAWYCDGVKLKMCPLLLRDPSTGDHFCAVYHLGPGHRPPACEGFRANWPHCEVSQKPLVP